MKKIYFLFVLMMLNGLALAQVALPYSYNFDNASTLTEGWQSEFETPTDITLMLAGVVSNDNGAPAYSLPNSWAFSTLAQWSGGYNQYLISPRFVNTTADSVQVRFKYRAAEDDSQAEPFRVGYTTADSYGSTADFIWRTGVINANSDAWQTFSVNLPADAQYLIIHYCPDGTYEGMYIDDILIRANSPGVQHSVFVSANAGGTVSPSASVEDGDEYVLTVTADPGHYIESVLLDGAALQGADHQTSFSYTLSSVVADHVFAVTFAQIYYSISVGVGEHGTVTPDGGLMSQVLVPWGHDTTFYFVGDEGYHVDDVVVDGYWHGGSISSYTFTNVVENHTINVSFTVDDYVIMATAGAGGTISPSGNVGVTGLTNQTFVITPDPGYLIDTVYIDGELVSGFTPTGWSYTFYNVTAAHSISAVFARQQYEVAYACASNGTVSVSGGDSIDDHTRRVYYEDVLEFSFLPNEGYQLSDIQINGASVAVQNPYQLTHVLQNSTLYAEFTEQTYSITVVKHGTGTVTPMSAVDYGYFTTTAFTFAPSFCCQVDSVLLDGVRIATNSPCELSHLYGSHQLDVYFGNVYYTMTAEAAEHGTLTAPQPVACGGSAVFTLMPDPCYQVAHFYLDGDQHDEYLHAVTADSMIAVVPDCMSEHTASAMFAQKSYTVNVAATGNGTVSHLGSQQVPCGGQLAFTVTPDECSYVSMLKIDNVDVTSSVEHRPCLQAGFGDTLLFALDDIRSSHSVQVTFAAIAYTLSTQQVGLGTVSPSGETMVQCSENQVVEITPAACSHIRGVWVDEIEVTEQLVYTGETATYTFENMRASHSLRTEFEMVSYQISLQAGEHGRVMPSGDSVVACGETLQLTIVPEACYYADTVWIDGVVSTNLMQHRANVSPQTGDTLLYSFSNIVENHIVAIHFAPITYSISTTAIGNGQIMGTVVSGTANCGDALAFTIAPDDCYAIDQVAYNGAVFLDYQIDENGVASFSIASLDADVNLMAWFVLRTYEVYETIPQHGAVLYPVGDIDCGENIRVSFAADACYHLDSAYVDGIWYLPTQLMQEGDDYYYEIANMHDNLNVSAHFSVDSVHFVAAGAGLLSVSDTMLACGQTLTCYSVIPDCQQLDSVRVNGTAMTESDFRDWGNTRWSGDTIFFEFPALSENCEFSVECSPRQFLLSAHSAGHGTVDWPSEQWVNCGDSIAIAIHPDDCYALVRIMDFGGNWTIDNDTLLVVRDVRAHHDWEFQFERMEYSAVLTSNGWGSIEGNASGLVCGEDYLYKFTPEACGRLDSVWLDGECVNGRLDTVGDVISLRMSDIRGGFGLEARFVQLAYQVEVRNTEHATLSGAAISRVECDSAYSLHLELEDCYYLADILVNGISKIEEMTASLSSYDFTIPAVHADQVIELEYGIEHYTVRRQVREDGNVVEDVFSEVACGSDTLLSALWPDDCYSVISVKCNGTETTVMDAYSFENIHHFVFLQIEIKRNNYHINVQSVANCQISAGSSVDIVECGENINYFITPDDGYYVVNIVVDGVYLPADSHYEFVDVHADHTLSAVVAGYTYSLQCRVVAGEGTVAPTDTILPYGTDAMVNLQPAGCQHVDSVWVNGEYVGRNSEYHFVMLQDVSLEVKFATDTNRVTVLCEDNGHVSCGNDNPVVCGHDFSITITPDDCYRIASVHLDGIEHLQDVDMMGDEGILLLHDVTANHTVKIVFARISYSVTATFGEGGTVNPQSVQCNCSENLMMDIKPEECYHIDSVFVNDVYVGTPIQYQFNNVRGDSTLRAVFARDSFMVVAIQNEGGTITPVDTSWVLCGDNVTYTITPDAGHFVSELLIDGMTQTPANSYTFVNVTSAHTIEVVFEIYKYKITADAGPGGSMQPSSEVWVMWGEQQHFDIVPEHCYHIDSVFVDGVYYGNISEYTFTHVTAPHEISAVFAQNRETITASAGEGGTIAPAGAIQLLCGESQTFTIQPDGCHYVLDVLVDGLSVGAVDTYSFNAVEENQTIEAVFGTLSKEVSLNVVGDGGNLMPDGDTAVTCGDDLSVAIIPAPCHIIESIQVNGEEWTGFNPAGDTYTFTDIRGDSSLTAAFAMDKDTVTVTSLSAHGTVSSLGENVLDCGSDFSVTITPDDCYRVGSVRVDGIIQSSSSLQTIGDSKVLTLNDVVANHTISVNFNQLDYLLIARTDGGGTISPMGAFPTCGSSMTFTVEPVNCYAVDSVFVNGVYLPNSNLTFDGDIATFELTDIREDINIYVKFRGLHYQLNIANNGDGEVMLSQGGVDCDGDLTFSILPSSCERIAQVLLNGEDITDGLTFHPNVVSWLPDTAVYVITNVQANQDLVINYQSVADKQIVVNYYEGTQLMAQDVMSMGCGSDTTLQLAYTCYAVDSVMVNGEDVIYTSVGDSAAVYSLHNILVDYEIYAFFSQKHYTIMATAGDGGSITPAGATEVLCGGSQSYTITPDEGYYIASLTVDGEAVTAQDSWSFSDVRGDHTIAVTFGHYSYTVTATADEGGSVSPAGTTSVEYGEGLSITITPDDCYHIDSVFIDGVYSGAVTDYTFSNVTADHTLSATFGRDSYTIMATADDGGSITPAGATEVLCGGSQSYTITPDEGYYIASLTVDGEQQAAQNSWTFSDVRGDHTIAVTFGHYSYMVTATAGEGGSVTPAGTTSVEYGENLTVNITADDCYHIDSVFIDGVYSGAITNYTFSNVTADHTLSVTFGHDSYTITANAGEGGSITPAGATEVLCGGSQSYTITPDEGYYIASLTVDGEQQAAQNSWTFSDVRGDHTIAVTFGHYSYTVTATAGEGGSVTPAGTTSVEYGESLTVNITADDCYHIDSVFVDGAYAGAITSYTFSNVTADHTLSATFARDSYTITASAGEGGSITPAGATEVLCGGSQSYIITPDEGYYIASLTVDGEQQAAQNSWTFSDVRGDHTIVVTFAHYSYTVTTTAGEGGSVTPAGTTNVEYGENLTVTIAPDDCYHIDSVFVDGAYAGAVTDYTFSNVTADHTLLATFARDSYTITTNAGEGGSITPAGATEVLCGGSQSYTITPEEGYYIATLTVDGEQQAAQNSWTFSDVRGDHTIAVTFSRYSYTVTTSAGEGGSVTPAGTTSVEYGEDLSITITPDDCYHIDSVFIDGVYSGAITNYTFSSITADHTLSATFLPIEYTLSFAVYLDGEVVLTDTSSMPCGEMAEVEIPLFDCYHIDSLRVNGEWVAPESVYVIEEMRMDYVVEAYLVADRFYVATSVQGNGTVLPSDTIWASCGEDVTLTFIPETGWFVQNLIVDGQSLGTPSDNSYTFVSISENHTLEVIFAVNQYVITSSVEPINAGQITPYGTQVYSYGDSVTYFIHPFPDYRIVRVEVDGEDVGAVDSYTFSFVDEHHTIVAYFETTGIDEVETSPMDIHVVNGELQVESTGHGQILSVEVFDLAGRCIVRHGAAGTMLQLPLPVATGVYVVRVVTTEAIESRKVSVNRW